MKKIIKNKIQINNKIQKKHILLFILVLIASFGMGTLAKYVLEEFHSYFLSSKYFYFTSNRLKENTALYQVNNWSGVGSFTISFDLSTEKNSLVHDDYDVPYTVTYNCPTDVTCNLSNSTGTIYSSGGTYSDTVIMTVIPQRTYHENESITIYLEASSTSPYIKTISANFQYIVGKSGVTYAIEDEANRPYAVMTVTNAINFCTVISNFGTYTVGNTISNNVYRTLSAENKAKCVSQYVNLSFNPNNLIIDTTNKLTDTSPYTTTTLGGVAYINGITFPIAPMSTIAVKFYKKDTTRNYTYPLENVTSEITVTITDPS